MQNGSPASTVSFAELLDYVQEESRRWREWFSKNPQALDVKTDIAGGPDIRALVRHVIECDGWFAAWLAGEVASFEAVSAVSADGLFATAEAVLAKWRRLIETSTDDEWNEVMAFPAPMEHLRASRRKCFVHVVVHGTRHWAQVASALRAAGFTQGWQHDFLLAAPMP